MRFGPTAASAHAFVAGLTGWMLEGLDGDRRAGALTDLRASMEAHQTARGVEFGSAMWLVTAIRD